jgi:hypothetical protein
MERNSAVTLNALASFARVLHRFRLAFLAAAAVAGAWFVRSVADTNSDSSGSLLALAALLWPLLALGAGYTLLRVPPPIRPGDSWTVRIRKRALGAAFAAAALTILGLAGFALFLSVRALRLSFG